MRLRRCFFHEQADTLCCAIGALGGGQAGSTCCVLSRVGSLLDQLMAVANVYFATKRYTDAQAVFEAVIRIDQQQTEAHIGLADCRSARGQPERGASALIDAARSLGAGPRLQAVYTLLGRALELDPERSDAHLELAQLQRCHDTGRMETARKVLAQNKRAAHSRTPAPPLVPPRHAVPQDMSAQDVPAQDVPAQDLPACTPDALAGVVEELIGGDSIPIVLDDESDVLDLQLWDDPQPLAGSQSVGHSKTHTVVATTVLRRPFGTGQAPTTDKPRPSLVRTRVQREPSTRIPLRPLPRPRGSRSRAATHAPTANDDS